MVRIKVLCGFLGASLPPTRVDGKYEFVYDPSCPEYDWLVVFDEMPVASERLRCPHGRTILCTWEPVSIKSYSKAYTRQFGHLLTNRPPAAENHPGYHLGRGYFLWFVRDIPKMGSAVDKPNVISVVCSSKQMRHTRHHDRFELVKTLATEISGFDWYGKGVKPLERKEDALVPYKYHVAIENHIAPHHWSEKFADAILCECLPFYAGDPALTEIFPRDCFIPIPIDDPAAAVRIVKEAIANDEYAKRREAILEAKRLILRKYNFWHQVVEVIESSRPSRPSQRTQLVYARKVLRRRSPSAALEDGWAHLRRFLIWDFRMLGNHLALRGCDWLRGGLPYCLVEWILRRREGSDAYFRWAAMNRLKFGLRYWLPHRIVCGMLDARRRSAHPPLQARPVPEGGSPDLFAEAVARISAERDDARASRRDARILVCLHLFYPDLWPVVRAYLENLSPYGWKLLVTYPEGLIPDSALAEVKAFKEDARFVPCRNAGYDVGPFVESLRQVDLDDCDIVFKLQTKGCRRQKLYIYDQVFKGADWFLNLYEGILGGHAVHEVVASLLRGECLMAAAENLVVADPRHKCELVKRFCACRSLPYVENYRFVAGTCFAARPEALAPLKGLGLTLDDFADTVRGDFSLAHALERWMCFAAAGRIRGIPTDRNAYPAEAVACRRVSALRLLEDDRFELDADFVYRVLELKPVASYEVVEIRLGDIRRIWTDGRVQKLSESAPYRYLEGDGETYDRYCAENAATFGFKMSRTRYDGLRRSMASYDPRKMPVVYGDGNIILDGQHRSCILLRKFGPDFRVKVVRIR